MKAIGITCGIGSMLVGARDAGFEIVGNVEWRNYYRARDAQGRNTFLENFPGAILSDKLESLTAEERAMMDGADIALGHPECGNFSQLSAMNPCKVNDPADIPLFVDLVAKFRPRFFVMDDLPKSFLAFPMREYAERLPDYDLFPEWISNWGYGNIQKNRRRMFMIGALKSERWAFVPGEAEHELKVKDVIGDLLDDATLGVVPNHDPHVLDTIAGRGLHLVSLGRGARGTFRDIVNYMKDKPAGHMIRYVSDHDIVKCKPGSYRMNWDGTAHVIDGGSYTLHHHRLTPLSIRERARLQGFPDSFIFYGTDKDAEGRWNHDKNIKVVKQTGKAMPIQFCRYVSKQIAAHIKGEPFESTGARVIEPRPEINLAKQWYCENVGYADQQRACDSCWMYATCTIRSRKYSVGQPPAQHDLTLPVLAPPRLRKEPAAADGAKPARPAKAQRLAKEPKIVTAREYAQIQEQTLTFGGRK